MYLKYTQVKIVIFVLSYFLPLSSLAEILTTPPLINKNDRYCYEMLKLALSYSAKPYNIKSQNEEEKTLLRTMSDIHEGKLSVFWTATDKQKEEEFIPIRIPLFKGMFGYRIFIIHRDNQHKFNNIETLDQLRQSITFGQGRNWADTEILKLGGGLKVVTTMKFAGFMYMVDGGRFDAFPRAIHEPWSEVAAFSSLDLAVEKNILLTYKMPFYFFVSHSNRQLADAIDYGLNQAIEDGSFDKLFYGNEMVKNALTKSNLKSRKVFEIHNPNLSDQTPVDRKELWLDISNL